MKKSKNPRFCQGCSYASGLTWDDGVLLCSACTLVKVKKPWGTEVLIKTLGNEKMKHVRFDPAPDRGADL